MRRKKHEEHVNHEAWAIPYADLMTLLLAFFVVMYAVSVVNEGKYRVASESILEAFNGSPPRVPLVSSPSAQAGAAAAVIVPIRRPASAPAVSTQAIALSNLQRIESQVRDALQPLIDRHQVVVRRGRDQLQIEIRTDILFPSGVAQLSLSADAVLRNLAVILAPFDNPLRVEGFTDDVPIATAMYPSNWELSAARAATVARLFADNGVDAQRLGIVGWGQVRPLADNATAEGRNQNRRVLVVVMGGPDPVRPTQAIDALGAGSQLAAQAPAAASSVSTPTPVVLRSVSEAQPAPGGPVDRRPLRDGVEPALTVAATTPGADPAPPIAVSARALPAQ